MANNIFLAVLWTICLILDIIMVATGNVISPITAILAHICLIIMNASEAVSKYFENHR